MTGRLDVLSALLNRVSAVDHKEAETIVMILASLFFKLMTPSGYEYMQT
jgi:hypothetical protein